MSAVADNPLVSVVVATYNMGHYLPEAVRSILDQSHRNVEVLVIDDGSTDDTPAVAAALAADPRVVVHRQPNGGQAKAKNRGIELARGDYIAFLDADDAWLPGKLERQLPLFRGRPEVGVVYSDYENMDEKSQRMPKPPGRLRRGQVSGALLIENFVSFPTAVVRRECIEKLGSFDLTYGMGIDYDLWLRISAHYEFDFIGDPTVRYRIWSGQMSKNYRKRYESAIRIMQAFLDRHPRVVPAATVREAWAHTYLGRGDSILWNEKDARSARADYFRALRYQPIYWPVWRAILKSLVLTRAPRSDA